MKTLYYVPMVHVPAEFGSLGEGVMKVHAEVYGEDQSREFLESIEEYWEEVRNRIIKNGFYGPKSSRLHVFVDGLLNGDEDAVDKTVEELIASRVIPEYQIIAGLRRHGARVHGTEEFKLLLEEYEYYKDLLENKVGDSEASQARLVARDVAIAVRIQEVMANDGDTGIIFIGRDHDVASKLPDDFIVVCL